jgi:hypothetical protein
MGRKRSFGTAGRPSSSSGGSEPHSASGVLLELLHKPRRFACGVLVSRDVNRARDRSRLSVRIQKRAVLLAPDATTRDNQPPRCPLQM